MLGAAESRKRVGELFAVSRKVTGTERRQHFQCLPASFLRRVGRGKPNVLLHRDIIPCSLRPTGQSVSLSVSPV